MNIVNQIPTNKIRFSHNIPATRRKEEELYRRMLFLNLVKDESHRHSDIPVISKVISEREDKTFKELILHIYLL
jgi:hypothetical protein